MIKQHLTQELLGMFLETYFKHKRFKSKRIKISDITFVTDFMSDRGDMIVEFDGYHHYTEYYRILKDRLMSKYCHQENITLIRIPYFIQLNSPEIIMHYFSINAKQFNNYPNGFISEKALRPCDFSVDGYQRYLDELKMLPNNIATEINSTAISYKENLINKYVNIL